MASNSSVEGRLVSPTWSVVQGADGTGTTFDGTATAPLLTVDAGDGYWRYAGVLGASSATRLRGEGGGDSASYTHTARERKQLTQGTSRLHRILRFLQRVHDLCGRRLD